MKQSRHMENPTQEPLSSSQTNQTHIPQHSFFNPSKTFIILLVMIFVVIVGVGGYTLGIKHGKTIVQNLPTTVSPTVARPSPTSDPTSKWKTYINKKLRYSIRYPEEMKMEEVTPEDIVIYKVKRTDVNPPADPYITVLTVRSRSFPAYGKTGKAACEAELCNNLSLPAWKKEQVSINNATGVKIFNINLKTQEDYYLASSMGDRIVRVTIGTYESYEEKYKSGGAIDFNLLKQILSTFKFIDGSPTTTSEESLRPPPR